MTILPEPSIRTYDQLLADFGGPQPEQLRMRDLVATMFNRPFSTAGEITSTVSANGNLFSHAASGTKPAFNLAYSQNPIVSGAVDPNYAWWFGQNINALGARVDTTQSATFMAITKSNVVRSGVIMDYLLFGEIASDGTNHGVMTFELPQTGTLQSNLSVRMDAIYFQNYANTRNTFQIDSAATPPNVTFNSSAILRSDTNNAVFIQQMNSSGSYVNLLYLNSSNIATMANPINVTAARQTSIFATFQATSANSGDVGLYFQGPAFTGTHRAGVIAGAGTTGTNLELTNSNNANGTAHAGFWISVGGTSGGDPYVYYNIPSGAAWAHGADNSDSDAWVLSNSNGLGTNNCIRVIPTTKAVAIFGTAAGDNAAAGWVGEAMNSNIGVGAAISLTTNTAVSLTNLVLTAGDWDITANVAFLPTASTSITRFESSFSTTDAVVDTAVGQYAARSFAAFVPGAAAMTMAMARFRISLSATTTYYLVLRATFTASTLSGYGAISARRAR